MTLPPNAITLGIRSSIYHFEGGNKYSISKSIEVVENLNRTYEIPIKYNKRRIPDWKEIIVCAQLIKLKIIQLHDR